MSTILNSNVKRVLVIGGGGIKGIIPAIMVERIEQVYKRPCYHIFDLICGTSTGAVIGGVLSAGVPGSKVRELYCDKVPKFFKPRSALLPTNWGKERYNREPFLEEMRHYLSSQSFCCVKTLFITTAFNLCSGRTHFLHSDSGIDGNYPLIDVISWSALSAAFYFGKIPVGDFSWRHQLPEGKVQNKIGAVWQDGGQGTQNSPVLVALIEALRRWPGWRIELTYLGTGDIDPYVDYTKAKKANIITQVSEYFSQARNESYAIQTGAAKALDIMWNNFVFNCYNVQIDKKEDKLDGIKFVNKYIEYGNSLKDAFKP